MGRTVLLADDSATIRKVVELVFSESDVRIESVGSGREALERLERLRPDLVMADVVMPGPDGYELCRQVKDGPRPVPVLLLASAFEAFDADRARASGADAHLIKPFESQALVAAVRGLLDRPTQAPRQTTEGRRQPSPVDEAPELPKRQASPEEIARRLGLTPEELDLLARWALGRLESELGESIPKLAERLIRERIRELEEEA